MCRAGRESSGWLFAMYGSRERSEGDGKGEKSGAVRIVLDEQREPGEHASYSANVKRGFEDRAHILTTFSYCAGGTA